MVAEVPARIFLMGPTASGKTALACQLAMQWPIELINVDSASVYRGLTIGAAKPDAQTLARFPHHLMDWVDPDDPYSVARFVADACSVMASIHQRGNIPLLVGGTPMYFRALLAGLSPLPQADAGLRQQLEDQAKQQGWPFLHEQLASVDPITAARLAPHDRQRIQRALEVWHLTGRALSAWHGQEKTPMEGHRTLMLGLMPTSRAALHARIALRFDQMLAQGLVQEVRALRQRYPALHAQLPAMRAVGYRQVWQYLEGRLSAAELREQGVIATRQLARRQLTWLRRWPDLVVIDPDQADWQASASQRVGQFLRFGVDG